MAGTNPKKAGTDVDGIPIYAVGGGRGEATGATVSCVFIPAPGVKSAVMEAAEAGIELIVVITEGVPAQDEAWFFNEVKRDFPGHPDPRPELPRHHQPRASATSASPPARSPRPVVRSASSAAPAP